MIEEPLWSDERIADYIRSYPHTWEREGVAETLQMVRDEYEAERKNKIFIPMELRGSILSTIQRAKRFLVELLQLVEENTGEFHDAKGDLDHWRIEIAEYDEILKAIVGERDGNNTTSG